MIRVFLIVLIFSTGFYLNPIYSVLFGFGFIILSFRNDLKFNYIDIAIFIYVIIISVLYLQLNNVPVLKEILRYVIGPFLFFFIGKADKSLYQNRERLLFFLFLLFSSFCLLTFFRDLDGNFTLNINETYYYNSRNELIQNKSHLEYDFLNETNLSLLVLTCLFIGNALFERRVIKFSVFIILGLILIILSSRTAVAVLLIVLLYNFLKYDSKRTKLMKLLAASGLALFIFINISSIEIPYVNTFLYRLENRSFAYGSTAYGLDERFIHYYNASVNSGIFNVKGYKYLLNTFGFSSHNELLGHTSAVGIFPALFFIFILVNLIKRAFQNLQLVNDLVMFKLLESLIIVYLIVGVTENIFISNTIWFYFLMLIIGIAWGINFEVKNNN